MADNLKYRVEQLEKRQEKILEKIEIIRTNHLPHLEMDILKNRTEMRVLTAINIGAIILALVVQQVFFR